MRLNRLAQVTDVDAPIGSPIWRRDAAAKLLRFAERAAVPNGFAWLSDNGEHVREQGLQLWINARMTYVFTLAHLAGWPGGRALAAHGTQALLTTFRDSEHGGWFDTVGHSGEPRGRDKTCYNHSFVLLAGSVSAVAGIRGGDELFDEAAKIHDQRFWDPKAGSCRDTWSTNWSVCDPYRGANSNMHALEAYLFAHAASGDEEWLQRGLRIAERICHQGARNFAWRIPEHFDDNWRALPRYNEDKPDDPFKPYGATPGHGFEWSRLLVQLHEHLQAPPRWLLADAIALFDRAADDTGNGANGFCYTTDFHGRPVVTQRFHWVQAEAILAADALGRMTGDPNYRSRAQQWWNYAAAHFVDPVSGSWHHELDRQGRVSGRTWSGKPDAYHLLNVLLLPDLPLTVTAAAALRTRRDGASPSGPRPDDGDSPAGDPT